jgi:threonine dehydrogenase-like Zn-dependent dehydrogenase
VIAVGVCGSDLQRLRAGYAIASLGHELAGRRPADGSLVAIRPLSPCRTCAACRRGATEHCANDMSIGRHDNRAGGFSGQVRVRPDQLYPIPSQIPAALATLADPLACILHALHRVPVIGQDVLVIGDGPMAALTAVYARQQGARQVTVAVKETGRIERMYDRGFGDRVVTAEDVRVGHYHVVVETVGGMTSEPILTAVTAVAPLGQVVALGVFPPHVTAGLPVRSLLEKEAMLRGSKAYRVHENRDDFAVALQLIATVPDDFAPVITSTPSWSPGSPQQPQLEHRGPLKTVYVNESPAT